MTHDLITLIHEAPGMYLDEIQEWLVVAHNVGISTAALFEHIRDAGLSYMLLRKAAAERDDGLREEWLADMNTHFVASQLEKDRTIYRHYGRAPSGRRALVQANFVHGERYNLLPALTLDGYLGTRAVQGSIDNDKFFNFIVDDVLPNMNPYPQDHSIIVLDNCAMHKANNLREVVERRGSVLILLPSYSPDLNPMEESFSCVNPWIRHNYLTMQDHGYPEIALLDAAHAATAEKAKECFTHSGFNM